MVRATSDASGSDNGVINVGLEGVVVAATRISDVRGQIGDLTYRGESISHWVNQDFASAAAAVLDLDSLVGGLDLSSALFELGGLSNAESELVLAHRNLHPMAVLQGLVPLLSQERAGEMARKLGLASDIERQLLFGIGVAARLPHAVATLIAGEAVEYPNEPDYITRFLSMLGRPEATEVERHALSVTQILQLEHSLNAGTFAARVTASTQANVPAAISSAFGALSGVLHGGADQAAMEMADSIGSADAAAEFVTRQLASGGKVMGMGHREYKVVDPRAVYVKQLAERLAAGTPHEVTFRTLQAVERAFSEVMAKRNKSLHANLEFYKGLVYRALGAPDTTFTALFAAARVFGYIAHVTESRTDSRIIRPAARYVGR